jgi:membrane protein YdbS with pleckstrin-like domain
MTNQTVLASDLPPVDAADFKKHPKRFLNKKLIAKVIYLVPLLIGIVVMAFFVDLWIFFCAAGAWLIILLLSLFFSYKEYFVRGYILREQDITYRHGWIFYHEITVPFNRIQHTEINNGPIDRLFNLCELEIFTAGGSASDLRISGLDPQDADRLKEYISGKTAAHA